MFLQRTEIREHTIEVREFVGEGSVEIDERILFDDEDSHIVLLLEILAGDVTFTLRGPDVANLARDFADRVRLYIIPPRGGPTMPFWRSAPDPAAGFAPSSLASAAPLSVPPASCPAAPASRSASSWLPPCSPMSASPTRKI
ncbi:hypothetical protein [Ensifer canadensis]|uniref:hypothetical protein n=1 Tax=Ensifer canadensis TaxID=555315 RepID=UPI0035E3D351